jgi:hypothetical protein
MISLVFLVLIMAYRPYCTDGLNQLQTCCLLVNVFTLFVGIMLIITTQLEDAAKRAQEEFDGSERDAISVIVFIANLFVILLPMLQEIPRSKADAARCFARTLGDLKNSLSVCSVDEENPGSAPAGVELKEMPDEVKNPVSSGCNPQALLKDKFGPLCPPQPAETIPGMDPKVPDSEIAASAMPASLVFSQVNLPDLSQDKAI